MSEIRVHQIAPLHDPRWDRFIQAHPDSSVFHSTAWLRALQETYGYVPIALVDAPPGREISNGLPFCSICSWITGNRLVSVPFSDHAEMLSSGEAETQEFVEALQTTANENEYPYIEVRPLSEQGWSSAGFCAADKFYLHAISLAPDMGELFHSFHRDCIQRKIRRAERERLTYSEGSGEEQIQQFYRLLLLTHKRHRNLPQSISWFRSLAKCMGDSMKIRVASKDGVPIASIVTLNHKETMTYKYGSSDARYHRLGGTALLLWMSIEEAKSNGMRKFDLGRSDLGQTGLITYKEHWNSSRRLITYWRYPARSRLSRGSWEFEAARALVGIAPDVILKSVGRLLYKHLG